MKTYIAYTVLALVLLVGLVAVKTLFGFTPRDTAGDRRVLQHNGVSLVYFALGTPGAPVLVMIPSLGRSASDFNELAETAAASGYRVLLVEPRGMRDKGGLDNDRLTLFDLADDVAAITRREQTDRHIVIGHAFGNRVARAYATRYGRATRGVVLLAAGGKVAIDPQARTALVRSFWAWMPDGWRRPYVRYGFFADGNEVPGHWMRGWNIPTSQMQIRATRNVPSEDWWSGGRAPLLVVQGMADTIAPPEHTADLLEAEFAGRVSVVRLAKAGHAILPEQPEKTASAVLDFAALHLSR